MPHPLDVARRSQLPVVSGDPCQQVRHFTRAVVVLAISIPRSQPVGLPILVSPSPKCNEAMLTSRITTKASLNAQPIILVFQSMRVPSFNSQLPVSPAYYYLHFGALKFGFFCPFFLDLLQSLSPSCVPPSLVLVPVVSRDPSFG